MPLKQDPEGGGTNVDGSKSEMYCSFCYDKGMFVNADWTVEQMQDFVQDKLVEMKFPRFVARLFTRQLPKLERWKNV